MSKLRYNEIFVVSLKNIIIRVLFLNKQRRILKEGERESLKRFQLVLYRRSVRYNKFAF